MLKTIVTDVCTVKLQTPLGDLEIRLELVVFRNLSSRANSGSEPAAKTTRRLQAHANYAKGVDYYAYADVTDIYTLPPRAEELVDTDVAAGLVEGVVTGLHEKAILEGERTGNAVLGPPTYLTANHLEDVLRQLRADRA
ncbi:hypothetical protein HH310_42850 [Actinoplanes sp. TBRC 11911]|uniref:hypothetical protein n=1 Tax=Actinoplanes sp. TBRC 11911 TaxID=2729386 RepID=UPI00145CB520|nr:hypothetical protein [Actinoplanes sp. TBRC 11911]NMO57890.1 hypothetical protein [Actinoplanes sp. TBRC 11911]